MNNGTISGDIIGQFGSQYFELGPHGTIEGDVNVGINDEFLDSPAIDVLIVDSGEGFKSLDGSSFIAFDSFNKNGAGNLSLYGDLDLSSAGTVCIEEGVLEIDGGSITAERVLINHGAELLGAESIFADIDEQKCGNTPDVIDGGECDSDCINENYRYAKLSLGAYSDTEVIDWNGWQRIDVDYDLSGGYRASLYINTGRKEIVIAFEGTASHKDFSEFINDWKTNFVQFGGLELPKQYFEALRTTYKLLLDINGKGDFNFIHGIEGDFALTLTGHSLGGGLAIYVGELLGQNVVSFNPAPQIFSDDKLVETFGFIDTYFPINFYNHNKKSLHLVSQNNDWINDLVSSSPGSLPGELKTLPIDIDLSGAAELTLSAIPGLALWLLDTAYHFLKLHSMVPIVDFMEKSENPLVDQPSNIRFQLVNGMLHISWEESEDAEGYEVYYSESSDVYESFFYHTEVSEITIPIPDADINYIAISAYDENARNTELEVKEYKLIAPSPVTATADDSTVNIEWGTSGLATGYELYVGKSSGSYARPYNMGKSTNVSYLGAPDGTYYVAIKAYDTKGRRSDFSQEVVVGVGIIPTEGQCLPTSDIGTGYVPDRDEFGDLQVGLNCFYANNRLKREITINDNNQLVGVEYEYYGSGALYSIKFWHENGLGILHGAFTLFHENGIPAYEGKYDNGSRVGDFISYNQDGTVRSIESF
jgi:hypothetical protein